MKTGEDLKEMVKAKYNQIALQTKERNQSSCCGASCCCDQTDYTIFSEDYTRMKGYHAEADLGLGCGIPTQFAGIREGDVVIDLGSGAGNDCFVARSMTGENGKVIGVDFAGAMITKARGNARLLGYTNVTFVKGDIEDIPLEDHLGDVVLSNCVLNLVPDKEKAFAGIYRVLKPGGYFCISDVVLKGHLPEELLKSAEMYAGCVSGAIQHQDYIKIIEQAGFTGIALLAEKQIDLPDRILEQYLDSDGLAQYHASETGIYSITLQGKVPE